jgi:GTP-binding protein HflX
MLTVFNKLDCVSAEVEDTESPSPWRFFLGHSEEHAANGRTNNAKESDTFGISALTGLGLTPLLHAIARRLEHGRETVHVDLPLAAGKTLAWLRRSGKVLEEAYSETAVSVTALVSSKVAGQLRKQLAEERVE